MLNKNLILKSIDDAIIKCSRNVRVGINSLSNQIKGTLNNFADKTKNNTIEQGLFIGSNGEELYWKDGTSDHVSISEDELRDALDKNNGKDLFFDHNHPGPFIDTKGVDSEKSQSMIPTILSLADVDILFGILDYNGMKVTPIKSITADCSNGTRMTVTRIDDEGEDLSNNKILKNRSDVKYMIDDAWKNMNSRWNDFCKEYTEKMSIFVKNYRNEHFEEYYNKWIESGKNDEVWDGKNGFWDNFYKSRDKEFKDFVRNNFENDVMKDAIKDFEKWGFELSMEWR